MTDAVPGQGTDAHEITDEDPDPETVDAEGLDPEKEDGPDLAQGTVVIHETGIATVADALTQNQRRNREKKENVEIAARLQETKKEKHPQGKWRHLLQRQQRQKKHLKQLLLQNKEKSLIQMGRSLIQMRRNPNLQIPYLKMETSRCWNQERLRGLLVLNLNIKTVMKFIFSCKYISRVAVMIMIIPLLFDNIL